MTGGGPGQSAGNLNHGGAGWGGTLDGALYNSASGDNQSPRWLPLGLSNTGVIRCWCYHGKAGGAGTVAGTDFVSTDYIKGIVNTDIGARSVGLRGYGGLGLGTGGSGVSGGGGGGSPLGLPRSALYSESGYGYGGNGGGTNGSTEAGYVASDGGTGVCIIH